MVYDNCGLCDNCGLDCQLDIIGLLAFFVFVFVLLCFGFFVLFCALCASRTREVVPK